MKLSAKLLSGLFLVALVAFTVSSCKKKHHDTKPVPREQSYNINEYNASGISGTAKFKEILNSDSVSINLHLKGDKINDLINLYGVIKGNTSLEDGDVLFNLGKFKTEKKKGELNTEIKLSYDDLIDMNGSLAIYSISEGNNTFEGLQAESELGENENFKKVTLEDLNETVNGQLRMYKRDDGSYLVIKLDQDKINAGCKGNNHPVTIYSSDGLADTDFKIDSVAHENGISATNLPNHPYKDLKNYDGKINIFCSGGAQSTTVISKGKFKK